MPWLDSSWLDLKWIRSTLIPLLDWLNLTGLNRHDSTWLNSHLLELNISQTGLPVQHEGPGLGRLLSDFGAGSEGVLPQGPPFDAAPGQKEVEEVLCHAKNLLEVVNLVSQRFEIAQKLLKYLFWIVVLRIAYGVLRCFF